MHIILKSERLILRQFFKDDEPYIFKLHNDADVMKYISSNKGHYSHEECREFITRQIKYYASHPGLGIWAAVNKSKGEFIGWVALKDLDNSEYIEVGYRLLKEHWGKGYATDATKALINYGFNKLDLDKITAVALPENKASTNVMQKAGMKYVGIKKYYNADVVFYEINK